MINLKNKIVLITGASGGIGKSIVRKFVSLEAIVFGTGTKDQKLYIENRCKENGINNISVITQDMNDFNIDSQFDRVVSVEMFEHMRNYQNLLKKVSTNLRENGKLFINIFSH